VIRTGVLGLAALIGGCSSNPDVKTTAIAAAALTELARTLPWQRLCAERDVAPWTPAVEINRIDPPPPPGFAPLLTSGGSRGGGALIGDTVGTVPIRNGADCFDLRGPLVIDDRAMMEVHLPGIGWNAWMMRRDDRWVVVMVTSSVYPG